MATATFNIPSGGTIRGVSAGTSVTLTGSGTIDGVRYVINGGATYDVGNKFVNGFSYLLESGDERQHKLSSSFLNAMRRLDILVIGSVEDYVELNSESNLGVTLTDTTDFNKNIRCMRTIHYSPITGPRNFTLSVT